MLYTLNKLDYETSSTHELTVIAYDLGDPALTSTTYVTVNVLDLIDELPHFEKDIYKVRVKEDTKGRRRSGYFECWEVVV